MGWGIVAWRGKQTIACGGGTKARKALDCFFFLLNFAYMQNLSKNISGQKNLLEYKFGSFTGGLASAAANQKACPFQTAPSAAVRRGFTLMELLVVVLIIGVLAAIAYPQYSRAVAKAKAIKVISLMSQINRSQELYYMNNALYAEDPNELDFTFPAGAELDSNGKWQYEDFSCKLCADKYNGKCIAIACTLSNGRESLAFALYYYNSPHSDKFFCSSPIAGTNTEIVDPLCKSLGFTHQYSTGRWYKLVNE